MHSYTAWVLSRAGKHREAIEDGRRAVQLSPESEMSSCSSAYSQSAGEHQPAFDAMKRLEKHGLSEQYARIIEDFKEGRPVGEAAGHA